MLSKFLTFCTTLAKEINPFMNFRKKKSPLHFRAKRSGPFSTSFQNKCCFPIAPRETPT